MVGRLSGEDWGSILGSTTEVNGFGCVLFFFFFFLLQWAGGFLAVDSGGWLAVVCARAPEAWGGFCILIGL